MYLVGSLSTSGLAHCIETAGGLLCLLHSCGISAKGASPLLQGFKWELSIDAVFVTTCLLLAWQPLGVALSSHLSLYNGRNLHQIRLQSSWRYTMIYAAMITAACESLCFYTSGRIHIEVLLPAFVIGCMTRICRPVDPWCEVLDESWEEYVKSLISTFFMLLVGMSMPSLFTVSGHLTAGQTALHVFVVSVLMVLGKMMLLFCYRKEADLKTRLALSLGAFSKTLSLRPKACALEARWVLESSPSP